MKEILTIVPVVIYSVVGIISMAMALKTMSSRKYLPFHEQAAGKSWGDIEPPLKPVILSLMRLGGLGFLVTGILLVTCPVVSYITGETFYKYFIPGVALVFCCGLFFINYRLYRITTAETPWKGSLYASFLILTGIILSLFI